MPKIPTKSKFSGYEPIIRIGGFLVSIFLFWLFDFSLGAGFKLVHYIIFAFILATGILLSPIYYISEYYDKVLHFLSPFLYSFIVFFIVNNLDASMPIKVFLTFAISVMSLSIVEGGEYLIDKMLGWELQGVYLRNRLGTRILQSRHDDAMQDILFGIAGCLLFILLKLII